jgi:hypothetical protein
MLSVSCPQCSNKMKAAEELAGKKAKCGKCGHKFIIPGAQLGDEDFKPLDSPRTHTLFPPPLRTPKTWHYAIDGERKGPVSRLEIAALIGSGIVTQETSVWSEGMTDWNPAAQTELKSEFPSAKNMPPPLMGHNVKNGVVWTLALVPLLDVFTLGFLPWFVFYIVNTGLCLADHSRLRKAGHSPPSVAWTFLVPVYLFVRASKTRQRPDYAYVWILCFVISILLFLPIFPVR